MTSRSNPFGFWTKRFQAACRILTIAQVRLSKAESSWNYGRNRSNLCTMIYVALQDG